jgi:hypothetical protein
MTYNPFTKVYSLGQDTGVNYLLCAVKGAGEVELVMVAAGDTTK